MSRTFFGTPIGQLDISRMVAMWVVLQVRRRSKDDHGLLREAHWARWTTIVLLLLIPLLFGIVGRLHESVGNRPTESRQVSYAAVGVPDKTEYVPLKVTRNQFDQRNVDHPRAGIGKVSMIGNDFWQTSWFRITCFGLCLVTFVLIYRLRMTRHTHQLDIRFQERLAERTRIAQELHDTLLQSFQGLMLRFQIAKETVLSDPPDAKELLEQALNRADQALVESRRAIQGIRSVSVAGSDLADFLHTMMNGLVEEFCCGKMPPPITSVVAEGQPRTVNSWVAEEVCRIARETLWNSLSHARAQRIESEVAYSNRFLRLRFRDDGIGIDSEILRNRGREGHWGMTGMYERAKDMHARLSIWSRPGGGTEVELTIPAYIAYDGAPSLGLRRPSKTKEQLRHAERLWSNPYPHC